MNQSPVKLPKWLRNGLMFPLFFLNGWLFVLFVNYLQPMVSIFFLSVILAILLDYPMQFLQRRRLPRIWSLTIVLLVGLLLIICLSLLIIPALIKQIVDFIDFLPKSLASASGLVNIISDLPISDQLGIDLTQFEQELTQRLTGILQSLFSGVLGLFLGGLNSGLTLFFILVLTIFLLIGGETAWNGAMNWFSPWWQNHLRSNVPVKLRRFIGGQVMISVGFSFVLAVIFILIGVPLGLMFGFLIGMASLLPFMGAVAQVSVSVFLMLQDVGIGLQVFFIALILGQIVDSIVVPKVMEDLVGVNPIWLLFAVFLGSKLGGFVGILLAVPVASIIKDIVDDMLGITETKEQLESVTVAVPEEEVDPDTNSDL
ncbi:AI-2E family transporter [Okeania sp. SIO1I7]|uniref:AI-2E family transporter n=1 Tax=Okeania sp. SIO1I7 TaxID=2607772 RepID=UPI0013FC0FCF|nr:AI-2E family transporter [Okeania sp. SIO1I7]NET24484.1 AI-2E family transporter [Okeania sp. SIO1I7]